MSASASRAARWLVPPAAVILTLGAVEMALRVVPRQWSFHPFPRIWVGELPNRPSTRWAADSLIGWRMQPNVLIPHHLPDGVSVVYRADAHGFRTDDPPVATPTARRVVLAGDSFTFGQGVEYDQTFGALVGAALRAEVVNLGQLGFGVDQIWMAVRHYALPLRPELVIVGFIDEDFDRSLTAYREYEGFNKPTFVLDGDRLRPATPIDRPSLPVRALERHSAVWALVRVVLRRVAYTVPVGNWWRLNAAILDSLRTDCERAQVPVVFVRLPSEGQRPSFEVLRRHMREAGADFLDLGDPVAVPKEEILYPLDHHLNARGHRYVADHVVDWIRTSRPALLHPGPSQ